MLAWEAPACPILSDDSVEQIHDMTPVSWTHYRQL